MVLMAACSALAVASGGNDYGENYIGRGPTASFLALALGAPLATFFVWWAAPRGAFGGGPVRLGVGAAAGLAAWSGLSILWATAPDLAWLDANRAALALCSLVVGVALARCSRQPGAAAAAGVTAVALVVALWGVATKVAPTLVGPDEGPARLAEPMGYWNAVALLMAMGIPGAIWLTARTDARAWQRMLAVAGGVVLVVTLLLTYSRAGIIVVLITVALSAVLVPRGLAMVGAFAAAVAGATVPLSYALTSDALTTDKLTAEMRRDAGVALGWRLVVGIAVAAALVALALRSAPRLRPHSAKLRRGGFVVLALAGVGLVVAGAVKFDSVANRIEALGDDEALGNPSGRLVDPSLNGRVEWAAEALRGFADAPVLGQGAGSFRFIHLAERERPEFLNKNENILQPHQLFSQMAAELGVVGVLLLTALLAALVAAAVRARRRGDDPTIGLAIAIAAGFMIHVQVDWTWSVPGVAVPGLVVCGVVLAAGSPATGKGRAFPTMAAPALATGAMLLAASAFLPWQATRTLEAGYAETPFAHAATARSLNPLSIEPDKFEARIAVRNAPDRALEAARRATRKQPDNPRAWRTLIAAGASGDEATDARARVRELDPYGIQP
jgi:O-Antigen ligase